MAEWVRLGTGAEAVLALPSGRVNGSAVVCGELFGVTDYVWATAQRLADAGYVAVAPDFYWRTERRVDLGYDQAGRDRGFELMGTLRADDVVADVAAAGEVATRHAPNAPGAAVIGFSAGGHIAVLAATRLRFDLVVSCYGAWTLDGGIPLAEPAPPLDHAEAIAANGAELLGIVGDQDHVISQEEWARIGKRLTAAGVTHELVTYPGRPHGFLCPDRPATYDADASKDVWERLDTALDRRVGVRSV
jgi:carboxymethylenebutenolidase